MAVTTSPVDETKLNDFLGQMVGDLGAAANAPLMLIGDKLGLYSTCQLGAPVVDCSGRADRDRGTPRARMAGSPGSRRLHQL